MSTILLEKAVARALGTRETAGTMGVDFFDQDGSVEPDLLLANDFLQKRQTHRLYADNVTTPFFLAYGITFPGRLRLRDRYRASSDFEEARRLAHEASYSMKEAILLMKEPRSPDDY